VTRTLATSLVISTLVVWTGCVAPPPPGLGERSPAESPTGGLAFTIEWRNVDEFRYERYELDADGTFRGGGGKRAMLHETEWKTALDARAAGDLAKIFRDLGLIERAPAPGDALAPGESVEIAWWVPGRHGTWTVTGACPDLDPLHEACRGLNLGRFRDTLNALPEAGPRTR
jgi:hypothetical protein